MGGGLIKGRQTHAYPPVMSEAASARSSARRVSTTGIDARLIITLQELKRNDKSSKPKSFHFEQIAMKFGVARNGLQILHSIYQQFSSQEKNGLDYDGLKAAMESLGAMMEEKDMREIFYESDMVRDQALSNNEFVVSLAIGHLLGLIKNFDKVSLYVPHTQETVDLPPGVPDHNDRITAIDMDSKSRSDDKPGKAITKAFDIMISAYLLFDDDASGTIQMSEVRKNMKMEGDTPRKSSLERKRTGATTRDIHTERFKEMDIDHDGTITFQEFILTFQSWVGVEE